MTISSTSAGSPRDLSDLERLLDAERAASETVERARADARTLLADATAQAADIDADDAVIERRRRQLAAEIAASTDRAVVAEAKRLQADLERVERSESKLEALAVWLARRCEVAP